MEDDLGTGAWFGCVLAACIRGPHVACRDCNIGNGRGVRLTDDGCDARISSVLDRRQALVRRAADGDRQAWERLVDQYARLIWSITADFKLVESDAADVAQTTWLRLLEHIDRIEYPDRVGSWLAATARNECLRSLAARKRVVLATMTSSSTGACRSHGARGRRAPSRRRARSGRSRGAVPPARAVAAAAGTAHGRSARVVCRHIR